MYKKNFEITKKIKIVALLATIFFIVSIKFNNIWIENGENSIEINNSALTPPIFINGTPGSLYNWTWAKSQPWFGGGSGDSDNPYIIEDLIIDGSGVNFCIIIANSSAYFSIQNCTLYDGVGGIVLLNVTNGNIIENNCSDNEWGIYLDISSHNKVVRNNVYGNALASGIALYSSNHTIIEDNILENNWQGIYLYNGNYNNLTRNNAFKNMKNGICLEDGGKFNKLWNNKVYNNTICGIYLYSCDYNNLTGNTAYNNNWDGINCDNCDFNTFTGNTAYNNTYDGIYLYDCASNHITTNTAYNNGFSGIATELGISFDIIENSVYNNNLHGIICNISIIIDIYRNNIYENGLNGINLAKSYEVNCRTNLIYDNSEVGIYVSLNSEFNSFITNIFLRNGKHAVDDGLNNSWSEYYGNYWDNHTGPDSNPKDEIVDIPYNISGSAKSIDYLPLAENGPPEVSVVYPQSGYVYGNESPSYSVTYSDSLLYETWWTINEGIRRDVAYNLDYTYTTEISFQGKIEQSNWDALPDGNIILTFYARDQIGYTGSKEIEIIKDTHAPIITIKDPIEGQTFGKKAPSFTLIITDLTFNIEENEIWYSIEDLYDFDIENLNGTIDQSEWSRLPDGEVTITFYAEDDVGNMGSNSITIIKKIPTTIGLDYFTTHLLISLTSCVAIIAIAIVIHIKKRIIY